MHKLINELEGVLHWPKKPSEKHLVINNYFLLNIFF